MSFCKYCGAEIDWLCCEDGHYVAVDPEPIFVVEGEGSECFYDEERGEYTGRVARDEEFQTAEQRAIILPGYVPHVRTCARKK